MSLPKPIVGALELGFNRVLALDPESLQRAQMFNGKVFALNVHGLPWTFYLLSSLDGFQLSTDYAGPVDTTLRGAPLALFRTAVSDDKSSLYSGEVKIEGDIDLGHRFQKWMRGLDFDFEEELSKHIGDIAAHQLGNVMRDAFSWFRGAGESLMRNASEYVQEETRDVVTRVELDEFYQNTDKVRNDVARLEQRVARLQVKAGVNTRD